MRKLLLPALLPLVLMACGPQTTEEKAPTTVNEPQEVNVYTHRYYDTDKALFKQFEEQTGIKVNVKSDDADKLIQLLVSEGENTKTDVLITVDAGRLHYARELDLLQPSTSDALAKQVPQTMRDPENYWHGLTQRARVVMYSKDRVDPATLSTYADLTDPKWKGKISIRSSSNIYNRSLLAAVIANEGREQAVEWAKGIVANMAQAPKGNDRDQIKNVALGTADLAIANTYYLGKLLTSDNELEREAGQQVAVFFPDQDGRGAHVNVSGVGVIKHASNVENAIKLIEFLSSEPAQKELSDSNFEYPVNPAVQPSELLQSWGAFKADPLDLSELGKLNAEAVSVFEEAGWD